MISEILAERDNTHGSFEKNAAISQALKGVFRSYGSYPTDNPEHCEALDMIALKLSRILSGHSNFEDNWLDISGYAELARRACRKE